MYKETANLAVATLYDSFFKELKLKLSAENLEIVKGLIEDKMASILGIINNITIDSTVSNKIDEISKQTEMITYDYDNKIRQILGETDYENYKILEDTERERTVTIKFEQYLSQTNQQLDTQIESNLIQALYEGKKELVINDAQLPDFSKQDPGLEQEFINNTLNNLALVHEDYLKKAKDILSPAQFEQFENYLQKERTDKKTMLQMYIATLRMANQK